MHTADQKHTKLFVSHATPEDNYFAAWLSSKLKLLGYDVWCDLNELKGGEDFWHEIENTIRNGAIKFLFVLSESSIHKRGVLKELAVADKIVDRPDFILPLRVSPISGSDLPTELIRLNYIDFCDNWGTGLKQLLEKLQKDNVVLSETKPQLDQVIAFWNQKLAGKNSPKLPKDENYRSNWFEINIPDDLTIYSLKALPIDILNQPPLFEINDEDCFLTFACADCVSKYKAMEKSAVINVDDVIKKGDEVFSSLGFQTKDGKNKIIELLNGILANFLLNKGLLLHPLANGDAYYFPSNFVGNKVKIKRYGRRFISLTGKHNKFNWHYAIEGRAFLYPTKGFAFTYHVVFSKDGEMVYQTQQHTLRRQIGKDWYNKKWRDLLLGAILALSKDKDADFIDMPVCEHRSIRLSIIPLTFSSTTGYDEPRKQS